MDVKTLYTFLAVVDHRGYAAAGKAVGLSPSGVSLQIKSLEQEFALSLFDRTTRPPSLTWDGRAFVRRAREVVAGWERLTESLSRDRLAGSLELGAVPTLVSGILPPALKRLRRLSPELTIRLTTGLSHELEAGLERGTLDAALVAQPEAVRPGLAWAPFATEPLMVIAPRDAAGDSDREILTAEPFIRFKRFAWAGRLIHEELARRAIAVHSPMEVDTLESVFSLVAHGLGVSIVPRRNLAEPVPAGVRMLPFGDPPVTRTLGILERVDNPRLRFTRQLYAELVAFSEVPAK